MGSKLPKNDNFLGEIIPLTSSSCRRCTIMVGRFVYNIADRSELSSSPFSQDCRCLGVTSSSARIRSGAECPLGGAVCGQLMGATRMQPIVPNNLLQRDISYILLLSPCRTDRPSDVILIIIYGRERARCLWHRKMKLIFMTKTIYITRDP